MLLKNPFPNGFMRYMLAKCFFIWLTAYQEHAHPSDELICTRIEPKSVKNTILLFVVFFVEKSASFKRKIGSLILLVL